jgi:pentatricopeptide repeat protein
MTTPTGCDDYQKGLKLAEAGQYEDGLHCLREYLRCAPQDAGALNDAGAILHCLGRTEEAIGLLTKARGLQAGAAEITWNLVEAYLACGRAAEAARLFDEMERMGILSIDVLNRTAALLLDQGNKGEALEVLLLSDRLWPGQEILRPVLEVIRSQRPRVAFFGPGAGDDGTLADIREFVRQRFPAEFYEDNRPEDLTRLMQGSDIAWFDRAGETAAALQGGGTGKTVCTVRPADVQDGWTKNVRWEDVDVLALIGDAAVKEALLRQVPDLRNRTRLVALPNEPVGQQLKTVGGILAQLAMAIEQEAASCLCGETGATMDDVCPSEDLNPHEHPTNE